MPKRTQRECVQLPALFHGQSSSVRLAIEAAAGAQRVAQGILEILGCGRHVAGWRSCSAEPREQGRHQLLQYKNIQASVTRYSTACTVQLNNRIRDCNCKHRLANFTVVPGPAVTANAQAKSVNSPACAPSSNLHRPTRSRNWAARLSALGLSTLSATKSPWPGICCLISALTQPGKW